MHNRGCSYLSFVIQMSYFNYLTLFFLTWAHKLILEPFYSELNKMRSSSSCFQGLVTGRSIVHITHFWDWSYHSGFPANFTFFWGIFKINTGTNELKFHSPAFAFWRDWVFTSLFNKHYWFEAYITSVSYNLLFFCIDVWFFYN